MGLTYAHMDLVVVPGKHQVAVNPANSNIAVSIAKGLPPESPTDRQSNR